MDLGESDATAACVSFLLRVFLQSRIAEVDEQTLFNTIEPNRLQTVERF